MRNLLKELRAEGAAILLSSHQLGEVALVSDRIAFLHEGRLLRYGRLDELLGVAGEVEIVLRNFEAGPGFVAQMGQGERAWHVAHSSERGADVSLKLPGRAEGEFVSVTPVQRRFDFVVSAMDEERRGERRASMKSLRIAWQLLWANRWLWLLLVLWPWGMAAIFLVGGLHPAPEDIAAAL